MLVCMNKTVTFICTNDIHCAIESGPGCIGLDGVASIAQEARGVYGADGVCLLDAGDATGAGALGCVSTGEIPLRTLNECGYAAYCPGNADVTFGIKRLRQLADMVEFPFVCCNLLEASTGEPLFAPYALRKVGGVMVGIVGVTTPLADMALETTNFRAPQDAVAIDCCGDAGGERLYMAVQDAVDAARSQGARFVVLLAHLGQRDEQTCFWSDAVVANTAGIDLVVDGHSHEVYQQCVPNRDRREVLVIQGGTRLSHVTVVEADLAADTLHVRLVAAGEGYRDDTMSHKIAAIVNTCGEELARPVANLPVALAAKDEDGSWLVRNAETNLGDLVADAWCAAFDADLAFVPCWVLRNNIPAGKLTMRHLYDALPMGHQLACVRVKGRVILEALRVAIAQYPRQYRYWLQVSSSVHFGFYTSARRGMEVLVNGEELDEEREYLLAGIDYMVAGGDGGFPMFAGCVPVDERRVRDVDALASWLRYLAEYDGFEAYEDARGQGRIEVD